MTSNSVLSRQSFTAGACDVIRGLMVVGGLRKTGLGTGSTHMCQSTATPAVYVIAHSGACQRRAARGLSQH